MLFPNDNGCSNFGVINNELHEGNFGSPTKDARRSGAPAVLGRYGSFRIAFRYVALFTIVQAAWPKFHQLSVKQVRSKKTTILTLIILTHRRGLGNDDRHSFAEKETFAARTSFRERNDPHVSTPSTPE